ncbi:MAG: alpha/beta hydrolase [Steroidobacteraceae bacterium]|nr:alpha/beta hydrolase [Steroidobacteraceae bacterium]
MTAYAPRRPPRHETRGFRGLPHHLLRWGPESDDPLLFLHGYADAAATFQFVADELPEDLPVAAIDWRGFGHSARAPGGCYWFPEYYADLECFIEALCPRRPARLVGHSMGANVAMIYAGVRPSRVRALVNLEGFGLPRVTPDQAPARIEKWLDQLRENAEFGDYDDLAQLAARIVKRNPRLPRERAGYVAACWSAPKEGGGVRLLADPAHRLVNPYLYRREEMEACWRRIEAPVLLVLGDRSELVARLGLEGGIETFRPLVAKLRIEHVAGAGHMLHHEEPRAVARLIESFLGNA